jgi:hypothetical protein
VRTDCRLYRHRQAEDQSRYYCKPHSFTSIGPLFEAHHASTQTSRSFDAKSSCAKSATPGVLADALCVTPLFPPTAFGRSPAALDLRPFSSAPVAPAARVCRPKVLPKAL